MATRENAEGAASREDETGALRARLKQLERERSDEVAQAHAAVAAAQDRSYWLDRWNLDLNALMRRRGAGELRAAFRGVRALYRLLYNARNRLRKLSRALPERLAAARRAVQRERAEADSLTARPAAGSGSDRLRARAVSDALGDKLDHGDPHALAAVNRADLVVGAVVRTGLEPQAKQAWLGLGPDSNDIVWALAAAFPELECHSGDDLAGGSGAGLAGAAFDAAFALSGWASEDAAIERLSELRRVVKPGGRLVIGANGSPQSSEALVTPAWLLAHATPGWRIALYLPGGLEGDRDLYVLERG